MNLTSVQVRADLVRALYLDLVGPAPEDRELAEEILPQAPSRWYLTGFLTPVSSKIDQVIDEPSADEPDELSDSGGADDATPPERASARRGRLPSSTGMSFLVTAETQHLQVQICWGDYRRTGGERGSEEGESTGIGEGGGPRYWQRTPREANLRVELPPITERPREIPIPDSDGLRAVVSIRPVQGMEEQEGSIPTGARAVSLFVVNQRAPKEDEIKDEAFAFQVSISVQTDIPLVPRSDPRGAKSEDWDERVADLQYRKACEYAVGHGVSACADLGSDGACHRVRTMWIPSAEVERVAPSDIQDVELSMENLADIVDGADAAAKLSELPAQYKTWIADQKVCLETLTPRRKEVAVELLSRADFAAKRISEGIALLADPIALESFRLANRAMAAAARRRAAQSRGCKPNEAPAPRWYPFQLAFILMNLSSVADPKHHDREVVDLLFFPTGGGKTEAYLGLAAFTLVYRRLTHPGLTSAGLSVLMRYTLRLLTLDQLGRTAALICALELERQKDPGKLGEWPFEIGLWVGMAATPNRMGAKGDNDSHSARAKTIAFQNDDRKPSPIPLEECPWCGTKFSKNSFVLKPNPDRPTDLVVHCVNRDCDFSGRRSLPILGVDEPIYRRLPCFLIATVDKFAAMPWTGQVGAFFGGIDRYDKNGFYGPCHPGFGSALPQPLPPPDLVIQDELHLISGPLGTIAGLYESALDELCTRIADGKRIRPKVVASTATVRRAEKQIRALFNRRLVDVFPPPGPDRRDSFFAKVRSVAEDNARLYVGVAAQGRNPKIVLLRTYLALLGSAQMAYQNAGGQKNLTNPADPYMTLLGYFNSLRELGGSRRIIEDEVTNRLTGYSKRKRIGEDHGLFSDRKIAYEVVELTSRVSTNNVAEAKRRLAKMFIEVKNRVDVAIATNMISVGLDITRLGLMVVFGQPKTTSEYIQATSRVGRDSNRPGLVVTLLDIHKPRDRSHYERFIHYHETFYRGVEATSVTPFSPRALDRGLAGTLIALARHGHPPMSPPLGAKAILQERTLLSKASFSLADRAREHGGVPESEAEALREKVRVRCEDLLDEWSQIAEDYHNQGIGLQYQVEVEKAQRLLYEFLNPELSSKPPRHLTFRANRSMRDVEANVNLWLRTLDDIEVEGDEE